MARHILPGTDWGRNPSRCRVTVPDRSCRLFVFTLDQGGYEFYDYHAGSMAPGKPWPGRRPSRSVAVRAGPRWLPCNPRHSFSPQSSRQPPWFSLARCPRARVPARPRRRQLLRRRPLTHLTSPCGPSSTKAQLLSLPRYGGLEGNGPRPMASAPGFQAPRTAR